MSKGLIKEAVHSFAADEQVPSRFLNLLQADDVRLSDRVQGLHTSRNLPKIHTSDYKMAVVASADTVTLNASVEFDVGGVIYSTDDLTSRAFTIPDGTTKYLYAAVADDCGEAVDWSADPIVRKRTASMTLEDSLVESTPTKMLILKAVKASAGDTPTVTLYANEGYPIGLGVGEEWTFLDPCVQVLTGGSVTTSWVDVDISSAVPAGAKAVILRAFGQSTTSPGLCNFSLQFQGKGYSGSYGPGLLQIVTDQNTSSNYANMGGLVTIGLIGGDRTIQVQSGISTTSNVTIDVVGYLA